MARATDLDQRDSRLASELEAFKDGIGPYAAALEYRQAAADSEVIETCGSASLQG